MSRPTTGAAGLLSEVGEVKTAIDPEGEVLVRGELWTAVANGPGIGVGERVRVVGVEGLKLRVERASGQKA
jgi:membrane-bound serine protease (ClpP class)